MKNRFHYIIGPKIEICYQDVITTLLVTCNLPRVQSLTSPLIQIQWECSVRVKVHSQWSNPVKPVHQTCHKRMVIVKQKNYPFNFPYLLSVMGLWRHKMVLKKNVDVIVNPCSRYSISKMLS